MKMSGDFHDVFNVINIGNIFNDIFVLFHVQI